MNINRTEYKGYTDEMVNSLGEKNMERNVFFDMDGTLAEWREAATLEELLKPGYFETLKPTDLVEFANELAKNQNFHCYVLSAYMPESNALKEKKEWCKKYLPQFDESHLLFVPCGVSKAKFVAEALHFDYFMDETEERQVLSEHDFLVDDYSYNLNDWAAAGGNGIKWINDVNGEGKRFKGWRAFSINDLKSYLGIYD